MLHGKVALVRHWLGHLLSILRTDKVRLSVPAGYVDMPGHQGIFDRNSLILPDVLTQGAVPEDVALKPVFNLVWQAAGFRGSMSYNRYGWWVPRQE